MPFIPSQLYTSHWLAQENFVNLGQMSLVFLMYFSWIMATSLHKISRERDCIWRARRLDLYTDSDISAHTYTYTLTWAD